MDSHQKARKGTADPRKPDVVKWTRASVSRVKTGCKTCKIRHLKCDEEKPTCQRCRRDKRRCDGYEPPRPRASRTKKVVSTLSTLPASLSALASQNQHESYFFHHAIFYTINAIGDSSTLPAFWRNFVPQLGHHTDAIRHALIALGAAHRGFLLRGRENRALSPAEEQHEAFAVGQYNQAISHVTAIMEAPSEVNIRITLVCCLIFVCLENLRGDSDESVRHLRAGSKLLCALHENRNLLEPGPGSSKASLVPIDDIALMFSRLGLDAGYYLEDQVATHLSLYSPPVVVDESTAMPFASAAEAFHSLSIWEIQFDLGFNYFAAPLREQWEKIDKEIKSMAPSSRIPWDSTYPVLGPEPGTLDWPAIFHHWSWLQNPTPQQRDVLLQYGRWTSRCNAFLAGVRTELLSPDDSKLCLFLSFLQAAWDVIFAHEFWEPKPNRDDKRRSIEALVEQAEAMVKSGVYAPHPVFSFDANFIPPLTYAGFCADDPALVRRIIAVFRSIDLREGLWDSQEMAEACEIELEKSLRGAAAVHEPGRIVPILVEEDPLMSTPVPPVLDVTANS